ncbi:hypothetical protein BgiMline_021132, partial [Biomphalaria glabrata]
MSPGSITLTQKISMRVLDYQQQFTRPNVGIIVIQRLCAEFLTFGIARNSFKMQHIQISIWKCLCVVYFVFITLPSFTFATS